jgi:hypothetical protein
MALNRIGLSAQWARSLSVLVSGRRAYRFLALFAYSAVPWNGSKKFDITPRPASETDLVYVGKLSMSSDFAIGGLDDNN